MRGRPSEAALSRAVNLDDLRRRARRRLPRAVFDVIDGGAGGEWTVRENERAYERLPLAPRALADVRRRTLSTTVLGEEVALPVLLAPCGFARMCDGRGELAAAASAARAGTVFVVSGASSYSYEQVARASPRPPWYQLYLTADRERTAGLLERVAAAGCRTLVVTVDSPLIPSRERDIRNRISVPPRPSARLLLAGASRPRWAAGFLLGGPRGASAGPAAARRAEPASLRAGLRRLSRAVTDMAYVTFGDIAWLRERWRGRLVLKGIQRGDEIPQIVDCGVDGVIVSNHGGRNLDGVRATIDALPEVVAAADGRVPVLVDGGVRRGVDVVRALALGAGAVLVGRPYMFALAAGGERGVDRMFEILRDDVERAMAFAGCATVDDVDASLLARPARAPR